MADGTTPDRRLATRAFGKLNLCLILGPLREDGYHELVSAVLPLDLADTVTIEAWTGDSDQVVCPGVEGDNLASKAIASWRSLSGWDGAPVRVTIKKRIPVAAGMGGGSADAAAALRLVAAFAGREDDALLTEIAPTLGADVPPLLHGGPTLVRGTGTEVLQLPTPQTAGYLILPSNAGLSTPVVFRQAGEMGLRRSQADLDLISESLQAAAKDEGWGFPPELLGVNDLGPAAAVLEPSVSEALSEAREAGADQAFVTGSGPTVIGYFHGNEGPMRAAAAAEALGGRVPGAIACTASPRSATIEEVQ